MTADELQELARTVAQLQDEVNSLKLWLRRGLLQMVKATELSSLPPMDAQIEKAGAAPREAGPAARPALRATAGQLPPKGEAAG
jgi:hypothetical protein